MKTKFDIITSTCVPLPLENVDTDQIIPARFLKATTRVEKFFTGPLGQRVLHADRVYKEQRFIVSIPAGLTDKTLSGEDAAQPMILQGAVDCMFEENGSLYILDFKTDRCYNKQELWERYGPQLTLYKEAMTRVMNKEVKDTVLYSFYMNAPVYAPGKE